MPDRLNTNNVNRIGGGAKDENRDFTVNHDSL